MFWAEQSYAGGMPDAESPQLMLGRIIRSQRELAELPMRQLAATVGISNPYLSQIERGLRAPSEAVLNAIAESLQTSVDRLYDDAGFVEADPQGGAAARVTSRQTLRQRPSSRARSARRWSRSTGGSSTPTPCVEPAESTRRTESGHRQPGGRGELLEEWLPLVAQ